MMSDPFVSVTELLVSSTTEPVSNGDDDSAAASPSSR